MFITTHISKKCFGAFALSLLSLCAISAVTAKDARAGIEILPQTAADGVSYLTVPDAAGGKKNPDTGSVMENLFHEGFIPLDRRLSDKPDSFTLSVYADETLESLAFVKTQVLPSNPELMGKIIALESGMVYHGRLPSQAPFALFVDTKSREQMLRIVSSIVTGKHTALAPGRPAFLARVASTISGLLITSAMADSCEQETPEQKRDFARKISNEVLRIEDNLPNWMRCPWGVLRGLWESSGGALYNLGRGVVAVGRTGVHIVEASGRSIAYGVTGKKREGDLGDMWKRTKETANNLVKLLKYFDMKEIFASLYGKDFEKKGYKTQLGCQVFTEVAASIALAHFPLSSTMSLAQKATVLYRNSSTYRSAVNAAKAMAVEAPEMGVRMENKAAARALAGEQKGETVYFWHWKDYRETVKSNNELKRQRQEEAAARAD